MAHVPRRSTLFPYTTLFRSVGRGCARVHRKAIADPDVAAAMSGSAMLSRARSGDVTALCPGDAGSFRRTPSRSEEHTSELQSHVNLVCRLLLEKKKVKAALE